jgi:site-specific recombinase XerD
MSTIKLGKTKDSRTRGKAKVIEDQSNVLRLKEELKEQKEFVDYLLMKGYSLATVKRYVRDTEAFLRWTIKETIPHEFIVYSDVLHYIQGIKKRVKQRSVSAQMNSLKHYFNFLELTQQISENPTTQIKIRGVKRKILYDILSHQELESLYNNFEIPEQEGNANKNQNWFKASILTGNRNKVILGLMIYQGLNSHELGALTERDLKLREGKIFIAGTRKSNERELKLEAHQVLDIMEYQLKTRLEILRQTGKSCDKLFISIGSSEHFRSIINKLIQKLHKQNSKVTTAKQIRASVITHWLKIYNLRQVQHMAGHRFVSSTESYLINDLDDLSEEVSKYHPIG